MIKLYFQTVEDESSATVTILDNDDLARGKTATASSTYGTTNTPAKAVDGNASIAGDEGGMGNSGILTWRIPL